MMDGKEVVPAYIEGEVGDFVVITEVDYQDFELGKVGMIVYKEGEGGCWIDFNQIPRKMTNAEAWSADNVLYAITTKFEVI